MRGVLKEILANGHALLSADQDGELFFVPSWRIEQFRLKIGDSVEFYAAPAESKWQYRKALIQSRLPANPLQLVTLDRVISTQGAAAMSGAVEFQPLTQDESTRLTHLLVDLFVDQGKAAWPVKLFTSVENTSQSWTKDWLKALDLALLEVWLRTASLGLLSALENVTPLNISRHLQEYPDSQRVVRFLWTVLNVVPEIQAARPNARGIHGWIPTHALQRIELPADYSWDDVVGQPKVRWSLLINKDTGLLGYRQTRPIVTHHDFALYLYNGNLDLREAERLRTTVATNRGLRAAVVAVEKDMSREAAYSQIKSATLRCLRYNVDVFLSRSVSGDAFFGRMDELDAISTAFSRGAGVALTGARKIGKSSLAMEYATEVAHSTTSILDFNQVPGPYEEAVLATEVSKRVKHPCTSFAALYDALGSGQSEPPFLVIDEFGIPLQYAQTNIEAASGAFALLNFLRSSLENDRLRVILCNPRQTWYRDPYFRTALGTFDNPLLNRIEVIPLRGLERQSAEDLIRFYARRGLVTLDPDAVDEIASACGGIPLLLRATLHRVTHGRERPCVVTRRDVELALVRDEATDSPWQITRTALWQWAIGWAAPYLRRVLAGDELPDDRITDELRAAGVLDARGQLAFPLLRSVAHQHSTDLDWEST